MAEIYANDLYMRENYFWYPGITPEEYEKVIRALANRGDNLVSNVMYGKVVLKPREERTREYIFDLLGIDT